MPTVDFIGKIRRFENFSYRLLSTVVTKSHHRFAPNDIDRHQDGRTRNTVKITNYSIISAIYKNNCGAANLYVSHSTTAL